MRLIEEPQVRLIASTEIETAGLRDYLDDIGANEYQIDEELSGIDNLTMISGKICYKSFQAGLNPNIKRVRDDPAAYIQNIHAVGHGSVCEHGSVTFVFYDVSRVFTHELVRHRVGVAMSQESLRYVRLTDLSMWLPTCIKENPDAVRIFNETVKYLEEQQMKLAVIYDIDNLPMNRKKELTSSFRRIAPIGLGTAIVWTMNMRAARHLIQMRTSRHAEEEIRIVFGKVADILIEKYPNMFGDMTSTDYKGIKEWTSENAAMPYDGEKIKKLKKELKEARG